MKDSAVVDLEGFEKDTRQVFDQHHREQVESSHIFERLVGLISTEYFEVEEDYFKNKIILDAGCGSNANAAYAFLSLGAKHVYCLDMGNQWMDCANKQLQSFKNRYTLIEGSVLNIGFENDTFDFAHSAGVLHHTKDPRKGFSELARVTKEGGKTFISIMGNKDGLIYQIFNFLREKYKEDNNFKRMLDEFDADNLNQGIDWILNEKKKYDFNSNSEERFFRSLFDNDLILTIKDRIQAPTYFDFDFTEKQLKKWFEEEKYSQVKRISRYTKGFKNLRRFLAPMYFNFDHPISRFWFGEGYIQLLGTK